jgi:hypothetical protein
MEYPRAPNQLMTLIHFQRIFIFGKQYKTNEWEVAVSTWVVRNTTAIIGWSRIITSVHMHTGNTSMLGRAN